MLLHKLRGQYEAIHGEPDVALRKQQQIREIWKKAEFFSYFRGRIKWRYAPPKWLFLPLVLKGPCMRVSATRHVDSCG